MQKIIHLLISLVALIFLNHPSWAIANPESQIPAIKIGPNISYPVAVGVQMLYFEDPEHRETVASMLTETKPWKVIERQSPNFGFTASAYWFSFTIRNTGSAKTVYIELPIPFLDNIQMYHVRGSAVIAQYLVGDRYEFHKRPITHQHFVMPFDLAPGDNDMLMRISSAGTVESPLVLWDAKTFARATADNNLLQGIWMGVIGIMVIYNLLLYFSIRDVCYLYYSGFAFSYLFFQIALRGYGFAYLWPEQIEWNGFAISTFIALSNFFTSMLILTFLQLRTSNPLGYRIMSSISVVSAALFLLTFFTPYTFTIRITSFMTIITCAMALLLGYIALFRGNIYARYFCLAWTSAILGIGFLVMVKFGVLPANVWTTNAAQLGVVMLVALLSLALANRFNREKELRLAAQESSLRNERLVRISQEELLQTKINANQELELNVTERTQTLQKALIDLEHANCRLELLSTTDALTTLYNRGHFESRLNIEFKRAIRHQRQLSLILCDIDHFKSVNDNYGHKAGDECLRRVALILKNKITRAGDFCARYGGEEFIILLVDTTLQQTEAIALALCEEIRIMQVETGQKRIRTTASFGVASLGQASDETAEQLVHRADVALYRAKHLGRNQVVVWQPNMTDLNK